MNITVNFAVILFAVCAMSFKWMKMIKRDREFFISMLALFVTIPMFVAGLFSLYLNWNFTFSNIFRITFS